LSEIENQQTYGNAFKSTRMGRITIAVDAISEEPKMVLVVMGNLIPIHSIYMPDRESVLYLAISDHFDELESDELVPLYMSHYHTDGTVSFTRKEYKRQVSESTREQILNIMVENDVNLEKFKAWVRQSQNATDEDFKDLDDNFLEILKIYINRS